MTFTRPLKTLDIITQSNVCNYPCNFLPRLNSSPNYIEFKVQDAITRIPRETPMSLTAIFSQINKSAECSNNQEH